VGTTSDTRSLEAAIQGRLLQVGVKKENVSAMTGSSLESRVPARHRSHQHAPMRTHYWSGWDPPQELHHVHAKAFGLSRQCCENLGAIWHFPQVKARRDSTFWSCSRPSFTAWGLTASAKNTSGIIAPHRQHRPVQQTPRERPSFKEKGCLLWAATYKPPSITSRR